MSAPSGEREAGPRVLKAGNRGPFTLDGSRSYLIGRQSVAVIDPGPDVDEHVRALVVALGDARDVSILLTHHHGDHAGGAPKLAEALQAPIFGPPSAGFQTLSEGDIVPTDLGELQVLSVPGHTRDHLAFFWPQGRGMFVGDLLLGRGSTTWLGEYGGCVGDYLASLDKMMAFDPAILFPGHGNAIRNPPGAVGRFRDHRLERLEALRRAREAAPDAPPEALATAVYGRALPARLVKASLSSIEVMLHHLDEEGPGG
jgi:glyoxylase-like metal-dependent hydrolase (beta-lactamase superfamily II)